MSAEDCVGCKHINNCLGDCVGYEKVKPQEQTNEEWIRNASTEELAEIVYSLVWLGNEVFDRLECSGKDSKENDLKIVTEWLQEKHQ